MGKENKVSYGQSDSLVWALGLVESAVEGIVTISEQGLIEYMNPSACTLFGYHSTEILGENIKILMPNPFRDGHDGYLANYKNTGVQKVIGIGREVVGLRKDQSTFPMHLSISEVAVDDKRVFTGLIHDITDQKKSQQEKNDILKELHWRNRELSCLYKMGELLRGKELKWEVQRDIVQILDGTLSQTGVTGVCLSIDEVRCDSLECEATPWSLSVEIFVEERIRGVLQAYFMCLDDASGVSPNPDPEVNRPFLEAIARLLGEAIAYQEAETKVLQASKLASIGELVAGMGHEINNPVNGIINCADLLLRQSEPGSRAFEFTELIRSEAERIATIVRDLLTFSRQDSSLFSAASIQDIVDAVLTLSRKNLEKSHVHLEVDIPESLPKIECRSEQIQQVLMNLVINAIHALEDKYPMPSEEKMLTIQAETLCLNGVPHVRLSVRDNGTGISSTHLDRIYDPFFTTKGRDAGTGLGLSVSNGIVESHNGTITVETVEHEFTKFLIDLPVDLIKESK